MRPGTLLALACFLGFVGGSGLRLLQKVTGYAGVSPEAFTETTVGRWIAGFLAACLLCGAGMLPLAGYLSFRRGEFLADLPRWLAVIVHIALVLIMVIVGLLCVGLGIVIWNHG